MSTKYSRPTDEDIQAYLSSTPYAARSITRLSGGGANFCYRVELETPLKGDDEEEEISVVVKHAQPYVASMPSVPFDVARQELEAAALRYASSTVPHEALVKVPRVHFRDKQNCLLVMQDCGSNSRDLKSLLIDDGLPVKHAAPFGRGLGVFLALLHKNNPSELPNPISGSDLDLLKRNELGRYLTGWVTYGRLIDTVTTEFPLPSSHAVSSSDLAQLKELATERQKAIMEANETVTMGDFWPGNIIVPLDGLTGEQSSSPSRTVNTSLFVVDWEISKYGIPGLDIGQMCAELHYIARFHPKLETPSILMDHFLQSYRETADLSEAQMEKIVIDATLNFGVHLATWTPRVWGISDLTYEIMAEGVEHLLNGRDAMWSKEHCTIGRNLLQG